MPKNDTINRGFDFIEKQPTSKIIPIMCLALLGGMGYWNYGFIKEKTEQMSALILGVNQLTQSNDKIVSTLERIERGIRWNGGFNKKTNMIHPVTFKSRQGRKK
jgi:hypothetical protein